MPDIYCTKCGLRGHSKCPHCRSIFAENKAKTDEEVLRQIAQEFFEDFMEVGLYAPYNTEDRQFSEKQLANGDTARFRVSFWTYAHNGTEAAEVTLKRLVQALPLVDIKVAACIHDWAIMPGQKSSIGCGHAGDPNAVVPPDPFAKQP